MTRLVALALVVAACNDRTPARPPERVVVAPADAAPPAPMLVAPALPAARALPPAVLADLARLPDDVTVIGGVDLQEIARSSAWQILLEPMAAPVRAALVELRTRCGTDPLATATTATFGARGTGTALEAFAVVHELDVAALRACLATPRAGESLDGAVAVRTANDVTTAYYFVDDHTVLVETPRGSRAGVVAMATRRGAVATTHATVLANLDPTATIWAMQAAALPPFRGIYGSAELADGVAAVVSVRTTSMFEATQYANLLRSELLKVTWMDRAEVLAIGEDLRFTLVISKAKVRVAGAQARGLLELGLE